LRVIHQEMHATVAVNAKNEMTAVIYSLVRCERRLNL